MGSWVSGLRITDGLLSGEVFSRIDTDMNLESWNIAPDTQVQNLKFVQGEGQKWQGIDVINILRGMSSGDTVLLAGCDVRPGDSSPYVKGQLRWECTYSGSHYIKLKYRGYTDETSYVDSVISPSDIAIAPIGISRDLAIWLFFTFSSYGGESMVMTGACESYQPSGQPTVYPLQAWAVSYFSFIENIIDGTVDTDETSPEFGPAGKPKGGYNEKSQKKGTFDDHSDKIAPTNLPIEGISTSGFVHVYTCNRAALEQLGDNLFPVPQSLTDIVELVRNRYDMDYIVGCKLLPLRPRAFDNLGRIKVGFHTFICSENGGYVGRVETDYVEKDLGSIGWSEYWANFLDYAGTSSQLFLPFLGFVPIEPEFWNGGGMIHLIFRMNCITGEFVYLIRSTSGMSELDDSLIAQYGGNCSVEIPVTGVQGGQALLNFGFTAVQMGKSLPTDGVYSVANTAQKLCGIKPDVPKSGGISAAAGFFGHRRPFLLIKRQESQFSEKYPEEVGLPLYSMKRLGDCVGLTIAKDAHLDTIPADVEVKEKINQLLSEGVIL